MNKTCSSCGWAPAGISISIGMATKSHCAHCENHDNYDDRRTRAVLHTSSLVQKAGAHRDRKHVLGRKVPSQARCDTLFRCPIPYFANLPSVAMSLGATVSFPRMPAAGVSRRWVRCSIGQFAHSCCGAPLGKVASAKDAAAKHVDSSTLPAPKH